METVPVRHAVYASRERTACTAIAAALQAVVEVAFIDTGASAVADATEGAASLLPKADLLICDTTRPLSQPTAAHARLPRIAVTQLRGRAARVQMFAALLDGVDHVCSLVNVEDFRAAVATVMMPNVVDFGLARFRTEANTKIFQRTIADVVARNALVQELVGFCHVRGVAGAALARMQSVVDELVMNAQLDAPRGAAREVTAAPQVEWMWQDDRLWLAVTDWFGRLNKHAVMTAIDRAREAAGAPNPATAVGAGLGLFLVMAHVGRFIVQVQPEQRTEVVCVFDVVAPRSAARTAWRSAPVDQDDAQANVTATNDGVRAILFTVIAPTVAAPAPTPHA